jgi:hypothetical protein
VMSTVMSTILVPASVRWLVRMGEMMHVGTAGRPGDRGRGARALSGAVHGRSRCARAKRRGSLNRLLVRHDDNPHDPRDLLCSFAELPGEIDSTTDGVVVTLDPPDTSLHRRALRGLVDDLNRIGATFPGEPTCPPPTGSRCTSQRQSRDPRRPEICIWLRFVSPSAIQVSAATPWCTENRPPGS